MSRKRVLLDCAEFLDSAEALELEASGMKELRRQAELLFTICYEELGKKPELIDGQDMEALLAQHLPRRLRRRDPLAASLPVVIPALLNFLEHSRVLPFAFEARMAFENHVDRFRESVESGEQSSQRAAPRAAPVVHKADKTGRNDPCFCGSGKKFKKCHGKAT